MYRTPGTAEYEARQAEKLPSPVDKRINKNKK